MIWFEGKLLIVPVLLPMVALQSVKVIWPKLAKVAMRLTSVGASTIHSAESIEDA